MKSILAVALIVAATFVHSASAQDRRVQAQIPFSFAAGSSVLPAGTYIVNSEIGSHFVTFNNWSKHVSVTVLSAPDTASRMGTNQLVFHKYGDQYFLSEIRCTGSSLNVRLAPTKAEKMARKQTLEAGLRVDDTILLALN